MKLRTEIYILSLLILVLSAGCASGFRKQKYTKFRGTSPTYQQGNRNQDQIEFSNDPELNDSTDLVITDSEPKKGHEFSRDRKEFTVRRIDKVMAYANMLIGISATFVLLGVIPVVRGGFSMDRLLKETYARRDRTNSIITIILSLVGIAIFVLLAL